MNGFPPLLPLILAGLLATPMGQTLVGNIAPDELAAQTPATGRAATLDLARDRRMNGELSRSGARLGDGFVYADWVLPTRIGERFRFDLRSTDFDTYLRVGRTSGGEFVELAANDDAGQADLGPTDSRVTLISRSDGDLIVRVTAFDTTGFGRYDLLVTTLPSVPTDVRGGSIEPGMEVRGVIDASDAVLDDDTPYQEWSLSAAAGERFEIVLHSDEFDTYLAVGRSIPGGFEELAWNDDWPASANGTDSRLLFTAPDDDRYLLRVRPFAAGGAGPYTLRVVPAPTVRAGPREDRIDPEQTVTGVLDDLDARLDDDSPYHHWVFTAIRGRTYVIDLASRDFDTFLSVGTLESGEFVQLESNDDHGQGTDSRIELLAPESGDYVIRASALFAEGRGVYRLTVRAAP